MFDFLKRKRRDELRQAGFPAEWREIIRRNVPYAERLPPQAQEELRGHVQVFLDEKTFEGCGGLEVTDEMRVTIAAQACLLLLGRDASYFPTLQTILVYPSSYVVKAERRDGMLVHESEEVRLGESWHRGPVVLAWDDVLHGARNAADGRNVVLHEFAHQLDQELGGSDGVPRLESRSAYGPWALALGEEYRELVAAVDRDRKTVLREYAATNPAEFFAVATEVFFEKPVQLHRRHPELYAQLAAYYRQDPVQKGSGNI